MKIIYVLVAELSNAEHPIGTKGTHEGTKGMYYEKGI